MHRLHDVRSLALLQHWTVNDRTNQQRQASAVVADCAKAFDTIDLILRIDKWRRLVLKRTNHIHYTGSCIALTFLFTKPATNKDLLVIPIAAGT